LAHFVIAAVQYGGGMADAADVDVLLALREVGRCRLPLSNPS